MSHWSATVDVNAGSVLLLVRSPQGDVRLRARLPELPRHPRALLTLLEALAQWNGEPLCVAIFVAASAGPSPGSADGELGWPEESPLVQFHFLERYGRRSGGVRSDADLRRLGLLR